MCTTVDPTLQVQPSELVDDDGTTLWYLAPEAPPGAVGFLRSYGTRGASFTVTNCDVEQFIDDE